MVSGTFQAYPFRVHYRQAFSNGTLAVDGTYEAILRFKGVQEYPILHIRTLVESSPTLNGPLLAGESYFIDNFRCISHHYADEAFLEFTAPTYSNLDEPRPRLEFFVSNEGLCYLECRPLENHADLTRLSSWGDSNLIGYDRNWYRSPGRSRSRSPQESWVAPVFDLTPGEQNSLVSWGQPSAWDVVGEDDSVYEPIEWPHSSGDDEPVAPLSPEGSQTSEQVGPTRRRSRVFRAGLAIEPVAVPSFRTAAFEAFMNAPPAVLLPGFANLHPNPVYDEAPTHTESDLEDEWSESSEHEAQAATIQTPSTSSPPSEPADPHLDQ